MTLFHIGALCSKTLNAISRVKKLIKFFNFWFSVMILTQTMRKSCIWYDFFSLGGQCYGLGQSNCADLKPCYIKVSADPVHTIGEFFVTEIQSMYWEPRRVRYASLLFMSVNLAPGSTPLFIFLQQPRPRTERACVIFHYISGLSLGHKTDGFNSYTV